MADRRQNRRNNGNKDEDYNPKFRKMRKNMLSYGLRHYMTKVFLVP